MIKKYERTPKKQTILCVYIYKHTHIYVYTLLSYMYIHNRYIYVVLTYIKYNIYALCIVLILIKAFIVTYTWTHTKTNTWLSFPHFVVIRGMEWRQIYHFCPIPPQGYLIRLGQVNHFISLLRYSQAQAASRECDKTNSWP